MIHPRIPIYVCISVKTADDVHSAAVGELSRVISINNRAPLAFTHLQKVRNYAASDVALLAVPMRMLSEGITRVAK